MVVEGPMSKYLLVVSVIALFWKRLRGQTKCQWQWLFVSQHYIWSQWNRPLPMQVRLFHTQKLAMLVLGDEKLHYDSDEEEAQYIVQLKNPWKVARFRFLDIHFEGNYFMMILFDLSHHFQGAISGLY